MWVNLHAWEVQLGVSASENVPDQIRVIASSFQVNLTLSASLRPAEPDGGHHIPLNSAPKCLHGVINTLDPILSVLLHNTVKQVDLANLFFEGPLKETC